MHTHTVRSTPMLRFVARVGLRRHVSPVSSYAVVWKASPAGVRRYCQPADAFGDNVDTPDLVEKPDDMDLMGSSKEVWDAAGMNAAAHEIVQVLAPDVVRKIVRCVHRAVLDSHVAWGLVSDGVFGSW